MIFTADIDEEKARLLLSHLNRAAKKAGRREQSREKLQEQLEKVKKASKAKPYRKEVKELEKRLADVLDREEEILMHQKARAAAGRRIREKIDELERKLTRYIDSKKQRESRIRELEEKITKRISVEQREIEIVEQQLLSLEAMYGKISGEKKYTKEQLGRVKRKIETLKKRLQKIK